MCEKKALALELHWERLRGFALATRCSVVLVGGVGASGPQGLRDSGTQGAAAAAHAFRRVLARSAGERDRHRPDRSWWSSAQALSS